MIICTPHHSWPPSHLCHHPIELLSLLQAGRTGFCWKHDGPWALIQAAQSEAAWQWFHHACGQPNGAFMRNRRCDGVDKNCLACLCGRLGLPSCLFPLFWMQLLNRVCCSRVWANTRVACSRGSCLPHPSSFWQHGGPPSCSKSTVQVESALRSGSRAVSLRSEPSCATAPLSAARCVPATYPVPMTTERRCAVAP